MDRKIIYLVIVSLLVSFVSILVPVVLYADEPGRYQAIIVPILANGSAAAEVFILDTQEGHIWTWMQSPPVGMMLIYQGKLRPGMKMGDLVEFKEIFSDKETK